MIKNILTHIGGIENYGIISLCLFFLFFTGMLIWVCTLKKSFLDEMASVPVEKEPASTIKEEKSSANSSPQSGFKP